MRHPLLDAEVLAEADGNRTRQRRMPPLTGVEDRGAHQDAYASAAEPTASVGRVTSTQLRLTQLAHGGGCSCKIPPGDLEDVVRDLVGDAGPDLLVGIDDGD